MGELSTLVLVIFRLLGHFVSLLFVSLVCNHGSMCRAIGYGFSSTLTSMNSVPVTEAIISKWSMWLLIGCKEATCMLIFGVLVILSIGKSSLLDIQVST